jgi:hypothetical protein
MNETELEWLRAHLDPAIARLARNCLETEADIDAFFASIFDDELPAHTQTDP